MNKAQALQIGGILGKCTIKNLGDMLLPVVQLKVAINNLGTEFDSTRNAVFDEAGLIVNPLDGSLPGDTNQESIIKVNKAMEDLSRQPFDYQYQILTGDDLSKLAKENPSLTIAEVTALYELVK